MRLIFVSDLHGALERLELLFELTAADMYVVSGDLLYNPFSNLADMERFYTVQRQVRGWYAQDDHISLPVRLRLLQRLAERRDLEPTRLAAIAEYLELSDKAWVSMRAQYRALERLAEIRPRVPVWFLPGNYDMDLRATNLASRSLHRREVSTPLGPMAGFGGAPVFTPGVPQHLAVQFRESAAKSGDHSEPRDTLAAFDPAIAVTHAPPLGLLDGTASRHFGSWGIRDYVDQATRLRLLLCGHVHDCWGVRGYGDAWIVNAGNFGPVVEPSGYRRGGYFAEINIDDRVPEVRSVILKRIEHSRIWHLVDFQRDAEGQIRESEVHPRRLEERRRRPIVADENEAAGAGSDAFDLEELQMYNQIKLFMRRFETAESELRIDDLREIVRRARDDGTEIAFDVLGSLNMGQSAAHSDVDAVLYIGDDPRENRFRLGYFPELIQTVTNGRYEFDVTDVLSLDAVREAISRRDASDEDLQRFVVYRTIGRPVNVRLLRGYDDLLDEAPEVRQEVQALLRDDLRTLLGTYRHTLSFDKYLLRLREAGIRIPESVRGRIFRYLHTVSG